MEGMVVMCKFTDGTETDVSSVITTIPAAGTVMHEGDNVIDIQYDYQSLATFKTQQVIETTNPVVSLTVTKMPDKVEYTKTEVLDITGLVVTATYHNGETVEVTNQCTYIPAVGTTFEGKGQQNVQISYTDDDISLSTSYGVNVKGEIVKHGQITSLPVVSSPCGGSVGDHALFIGGLNAYSTGGVGNVTAYTKDLTRKTLSGIGARYGMASSTVKNKVLFGGGGNINPEDWFRDVYGYDNKLVRTSSRISEPRMNLAAATAGEYVIFASGNGEYTRESEVVDAVSYDLVSTTATSLPYGIVNPVGVSVGNYALIGGDSVYGYFSAYNSELVRTNTTPPSNKYTNSAETTGNYALLTAGLKVETYNESLVKGTASDLSGSHDMAGTTSVGGFAIFAGARWVDVATVDIYDQNLVHTTADPLLNATAMKNSGGTAGDYALFAYQYNNNSIVEAYQLI